jgi:hypothetical protein
MNIQPCDATDRRREAATVERDVLSCQIAGMRAAREGAQRAAYGSAGRITQSAAGSLPLARTAT